MNWISQLLIFSLTILLFCDLISGYEDDFDQSGTISMIESNSNNAIISAVILNNLTEIRPNLTSEVIKPKRVKVRRKKGLKKKYKHLDTDLNNDDNKNDIATDGRFSKFSKIINKKPMRIHENLEGNDMHKQKQLRKNEIQGKRLEKLRLKEEQKRLKLATKEEKQKQRQIKLAIKNQKRLDRLMKKKKKKIKEKQLNTEHNSINQVLSSSLNYIPTILNNIEDNNSYLINGREIKPVGDLSCMKNESRPAPAVANADIKYLRNDMYGFAKSFLEAEYYCRPGYKMKRTNSNITINLICSNNKWIGPLPTCELIIKNQTNICHPQSKCTQLCYKEDNKEKCSCYKGFRMNDNRCEDINECMENESICEHGCSNTVGSYRCKCPRGLRIGDANTCIDINECSLRNGHGPCQDTCINIWGSYKCTCDGLPGSQLADDKHSCEDVDECSIENGGCSHTCLNTLGRAFCFCPDGWILDEDWKTCIDVDECENQHELKPELRCSYGCINTLGSYKCDVEIGADQPIIDEIPTCPNGYIYNASTEDCYDIDECLIDNGGCYDTCTNTIGSYHCSCGFGYIFGSDKQTCIVSNSTTNVACPPLFPPKHGYLECSRPINGGKGRRRITNSPGSQCVLRCPTGYRVNGSFSKICGADGEWIGEGNGVCIRYPTPKLTCPHDALVELPPKKIEARIKLPRPKTDVHWDRDIISEPPWGKNTTVSIAIGIVNITFIAIHPISKLNVSCSYTITVLDGQPPTVSYCPETKRYSVSKVHDVVQVTWLTPTFKDNVMVTDITQTNRPGNYFGVGSHQIIYTGFDAAGYTAKCIFKIIVVASKRSIAKVPLPFFYLFDIN